MPHHTKTVITATDPHALARFWALALDWVVEDHSALIAGLKEGGVITDADLLELDGAQVWKDAAAVRNPDDDVDGRSGMGQGGRVLFQRGDAPGAREGEPGNVRVHLDIHVGADARPAHVDALLAAGATFLWNGNEGGGTWVTLADPEGNPFCVA